MPAVAGAAGGRSEAEVSRDERGRSEPAEERAASPVNLARVGISGSYYGGTLLVGHGSRAEYAGADASLELAVVRFPSERVGIELDLHVSPGALGGWQSGGSSAFGGMQAALDTALLRSDGRHASSLVIGAGGGFDVGDRYWFSEARAYALGLVRARWISPGRTSLHAAWQILPVSSGALAVLENRVELAFGQGMFQGGARAGWVRVTGGDPERTYLETQATAFVAFAVY